MLLNSGGEFVDLVIDRTTLSHQLTDFAVGVHNRGVVAPAKQLADLGQALLGHLFGQVHGNLARAGDAGRALFAVHVGDLDLVEVRDRLLDVLDRDQALLQREQVLERFLRKIQRDRPACELRVRDHAPHRAFQFAHVRADALRDEERHFVRQLDAAGCGLAHEDRHARL